MTTRIRQVTVQVSPTDAGNLLVVTMVKDPATGEATRLNQTIPDDTFVNTYDAFYTGFNAVYTSHDLPSDPTP